MGLVPITSIATPAIAQQGLMEKIAGMVRNSFELKLFSLHDFNDFLLIMISIFQT
jgi:hypothetical protein